MLLFMLCSYIYYCVLNMYLKDYSLSLKILIVVNVFFFVDVMFLNFLVVFGMVGVCLLVIVIGYFVDVII